MVSYNDYGWDWGSFVGSDDCLISNQRDLVKLDLVMGMFPSRTAVVQAGGNLGLFPKRLAQEFTTVYTFEPDPENFAALCHNAPEPNIVKLQAAVGGSNRLVATQHGSPTHTHEGVTHIVGPGTLPTFKIDDLALDTCELIYLDIEGYEHHALRGAHVTIARCKPVVVCEVNVTLERQGLSPDHVRKLMEWYGYVLVFRLYTDEVYVHKNKLNPACYAAMRLDHINGASYLLGD